MALVALVSSLRTVGAEEIPAWRKTLCFAYVAHDRHTDVGELERYLRARYERALNDKDYVLVVYLANEESPVIVQMNVPGDNRQDFDGMLKELGSGWEHGINPEYDINRIVSLVGDLDMVNPETGEFVPGIVDWHFHVTSGFWKKGYNESVIASLCFVLGVENFEADNFRLRCYFGRNDGLVYDKKSPFGEKDFCNLEFMPYYY